MKEEKDIFTKIEEFKENILRIEEGKQKELQRDINKRNVRILSFYNRERSVYEFAIDQLEWLLTD